MTKKLTRFEWIKSLLEQGMTDEEVLKIIRKGDPKIGMNPVKPPFDKLQLRRIKKALNLQ